MGSKLPYPEGKPKSCEFARCEVKALHQLSYQGRWMSVCGLHDRFVGGKNLVAAGWTEVAANAWVRKPY